MLLRIHDDFYFREKNATIIYAIEHGEKFLETDSLTGIKISTDDLDNFLGYIELLSILVEKNLIEITLVDSMFGHYIVSAWKHPEIQSYLRQVNNNPEPRGFYVSEMTFYSGFAELVMKLWDSNP